MNKTLTAVAVVLLTVTALFAMADGEDTDGYSQGDTVIHLTTKFYVIVNCGTTTYTNATVPSEYIFIANCNVKANAFKDCTKIKEVIFDTSVGSVGDYAFAGCTNLDSMSGTSLKSIGAHAFEGTKIFYAGLGSNLTSIGDYAFKDCRYLQKVPIYRTSLTSIGNGVFYGCTNLRLMDMRGITYASPTAFQESGIERQILNVGQTYCLPNISKLWIEDGSMYNNVPLLSGNTLHVDSQVNSRITLFDMEGNEIENDIAYESYATINRFILEDGRDYISGTYYRTVHFPDGLGLDDMPAKSGESFQLPTVTLGDITASKWVISGITGEIDYINAWSMRTMGDVICPLPVFNTTQVVLAHSDLPSIIDTTGLETTMTYTFGDAYPQLPDVDGYEHTGWRVGEDVLGPTDMICEFSSHTAYSLWTPTLYHTLTYTQKDGTVISTEREGNGRDIIISDVTPDEEDNEIFVGWELDGVSSPVSAGYAVNMLGDVTLTPVFDERAVRHISFISESVLLRTYDVYDGRTLTVDLDDPERDWFDFLYWKSGSMILTNGDSIDVTGDMEFSAYWKSVKKISVTYHVGDTTTVRDHRADTPVIVFMDPGESEGMVFVGWSKSKTSDTVAYRNGDSVNLTANISLYALWEEAPEETDPEEPGKEETDPDGTDEPTDPNDAGKPVNPDETKDPENQDEQTGNSDATNPGEPGEEQTNPDDAEKPDNPDDTKDPENQGEQTKDPDTTAPGEPGTSPDASGTGGTNTEDGTEPGEPTTPGEGDTGPSDGGHTPGTSDETTSNNQSPSDKEGGWNTNTTSVDTTAVAISVATIVGSMMAGLIALQMRRN